MQDKKPPTTDDLISMIRTDCRDQAAQAETKLSEVTQCLDEDNHLGALGAFRGLDEDIVCLKVFLTRMAKLTVGETT